MAFARQLNPFQGGRPEPGVPTGEPRPPEVSESVARKVVFLHQLYEATGKPGGQLPGGAAVASIPGLVKQLLSGGLTAPNDSSSLVSTIKHYADRMPAEQASAQALEILQSSSASDRRYLLEQDNARRQWDSWETQNKQFQETQRKVQEAEQRMSVAQPTITGGTARPSVAQPNITGGTAQPMVPSAAGIQSGAQPLGVPTGQGDWWTFKPSQGFGPTDEPLDSPYQGFPHFNKGIDYPVPSGTPIKANISGTVTAAGDAGEGWGNRVVILDAEGNSHSYGHLTNASVGVGDVIEAGNIIGVSGSTGKSTGPHLSYDVYNAQYQFTDPTRFLPSSGPGRDGSRTVEEWQEEVNEAYDLLSSFDPSNAEDQYAIEAATGQLNAALAGLKASKETAAGGVTPELAESARQFDLSHALDREKFAGQSTQFGMSYEEGKRQFDLAHNLDRDTFAEQSRQFGLSFGEGQRQFDAAHALDQARFGEQVRQFDVSHAEGVRQFDVTAQMRKDEERRRLQESLSQLKLQGAGLMGNMFQAANSNYLSAARSAIPPGQQYAPGFEPNGLAASLSSRYGVPFTPTGGSPFNAGTGLAETAAPVNQSIQQLTEQLKQQGIV
jgi:murein DD-endopeptidase MepM/ murein hydrolase activator NlpD